MNRDQRRFARRLFTQTQGEGKEAVVRRVTSQLLGLDDVEELTPAQRSLIEGMIEVVPYQEVPRISPAVLDSLIEGSMAHRELIVFLQEAQTRPILAGRTELLRGIAVLLTALGAPTP